MLSLLVAYCVFTYCFGIVAIVSYMFELVSGILPDDMRHPSVRWLLLAYVLLSPISFAILMVYVFFFYEGKQ